jgi:hypothetical protein
MFATAVPVAGDDHETWGHSSFSEADPFRILYSRLPRHSILWGLCEMCLAATHDFAGIGAVRFLLGFTEGAVAPSFMIITSNWYCRREHPQ